MGFFKLQNNSKTMSFQCYESFVHSNASSIDASNPKGSDTYNCERILYFFSGFGTVPLEIARDMHSKPLREIKPKGESWNVC